MEEEPSQFSVGPTAQSLTCSIMEKPHTGWDDCLNMLLSCFIKRMSAPSASAVLFFGSERKPPLITPYDKTPLQTPTTTTVGLSFSQLNNLEGLEPKQFSGSLCNNFINAKRQLGSKGALISQRAHAYSTAKYRVSYEMIWFRVLSRHLPYFLPFPDRRRRFGVLRDIRDTTLNGRNWSEIRWKRSREKITGMGTERTLCTLWTWTGAECLLKCCLTSCHKTSLAIQITRISSQDGDMKQKSTSPLAKMKWYNKLCSFFWIKVVKRKKYLTELHTHNWFLHSFLIVF